MDKVYDPKQVEDKWYQAWEENKCFAAQDTSEREPYCVVIPPPNVTGKLHIGHALNNTLQDILVRQKRMAGYNAVWVPGTDHAGIATQSVVEKALREEGTSRQELGREAFIDRVWDWKKEYGSTITRQLRKLGCGCDWERERFTMDEGLSNAVKEVFIRLYEKDLIYRGNYIINWSPALQTALADDEVEHRDTNGKLYYIRYPLKGGSKKKDGVVVATTRPETLLGDVAVAVNPRDERYTALTDKTLVLPILERGIPFVIDDYVDPEFGTGAVKITPAHDPNDFDMGQRHKLQPINVMNEDGTMNEAAGPYAGLDRFACRKKIVEDLEAAGLMVKIEEHAHSVGYCYRSNCVIEPRLSTQWFVRMKPLARKAVEAVQNGDLQIVPDRWTKVYLHWMENIRDWCISRQLWWGHRIPVYYCDSTGEVWAARETPAESPSGATDIRQDTDVLDTWFSSWLWPFSVHGWPEETPALNTFYPTQTLVTAPDIIFFWVARMVMAGYEFCGKVPFNKVYLHGVVRDKEGRKQSKSLGNAIDPLEVIDQFSADALRFCLINLNATGQDVKVDTHEFETGRNFCTKIWNVARFMQMHGAHEAEMLPAADGTLDVKAEWLSADDQHLLFNLQRTLAACSENLERFRFNDYAKELHDFIWHKFCDWHIESSKEALYGEDAERKASTVRVMNHVFSAALRLLHPLMPFISEELWHAMGYNVECEYIMNAPWPTAMEDEQLAELGVRSEVFDYVEAKHDLIRLGRTLRVDYNVPPSKRVTFIIKPSHRDFQKRMAADLDATALLLKAEVIRLDPDFAPSKAMPSALSRMGNIYLPIEDLVDVEAEIERIGTLLEQTRQDAERVSKKLNNVQFVSKAPVEVVDVQRRRKQELIEKAAKLEKQLAAFK